MEGKRILNSLPSTVKEQIAAKYGSLDKFYNLIFNLSAAYHKAFISKDSVRLSSIDNYRHKIAAELEAMGVIDGADLYDEIGTDYDEMYVNTHYPLTLEQENLLKRLGI